jgi:hypothetical protein
MTGLLTPAPEAGKAGIHTVLCKQDRGHVSVAADARLFGGVGCAKRFPPPPGFGLCKLFLCVEGRIAKGNERNCTVERRRA